MDEIEFVHKRRNVISSDMTTNYIWRKFATKTWLEQNEPDLAQASGGLHSVVERPGSDRLQVELFCERLPLAQSMSKTFGGAVIPLPRNWKKQFFAASKTKPLKIGKRLTIASDAKDFASDSAPASRLLIPAGAAFGTGAHATTAMSLRILERRSRTQSAAWRMFDAGTGTGILALAGWGFGAAEVVAVDNDPSAIATAKQNARANKIDGVQFMAGDAKQALRGRFNIIAANLYSELLATMLPKFRRSLTRDGYLILSGILREQERGLVRALRAHGFRIEETRRRGKWIALACRLAS